MYIVFKYFMMLVIIYIEFMSIYSCPFVRLLNIGIVILLLKSIPNLIFKKFTKLTNYGLLEARDCF